MARWLSLLWLMSVSATTAVGQEWDATRLERVPAVLQKYLDDHQISGAVTLIATADRTVHTAVVGQADIAAKRPMREDTIFRIASMTKLITATALLQLVEQRKLSLDDPVEKHLPAFRDQKLRQKPISRPITVRDILTHTAGTISPDPKTLEGKTLEEQVDAIGKAGLEFEPGTQWKYGNGLTIAGRLIEVCSGEDYAGYLHKHIFQPLQMTDSTFVLSAEQAARLAVTYKPGKEPGTLEAVSIPDPTIARTPGPSGGLFSTARDQARFYQAILNGGQLGDVRVLKAETVQQMLTPQTGELVTGFTPGNQWALGWCFVRQPQGVTRLLSPGTYGHGGAWGTQGWIDPARKLILVLMIQRQGFGNSDGSDVRDAFTEAALTARIGSKADGVELAPYYSEKQALHLTHGDAKAVLSFEAGGRPLEFSARGKSALWLDPAEKQPVAGKPRSISAGRFDIGPELVTPSHPTLWSGPWTPEIIGPRTARLTSQRDPATGIQLVRNFALEDVAQTAVARRGEKHGALLRCEQIMMNTSKELREVCHWGRSFSPGGGICLIPLGGRSRFPSQYAMYEDSAIINVRNTDDQIRVRDGFLEILAPPRKPKLGFDSTAGWLAYLRSDDTLFVKRYAVEPNRPYGEAAALTLSVWYPPGDRIELEPIGPLERLQPGQVASFTEEWWLLSFPFPKAAEQVDLKRLREVVEAETVMHVEK